MSLIKYEIGYSFLPHATVPRGFCCFSMFTPSYSGHSFSCKILNAHNDIITTIKSSQGLIFSEPISLAKITHHLTVLLQHSENPGEEVVISFDFTRFGGGSVLDGLNVQFCWLEAPQNSKPVPSQTTYQASFDETGPYYFLAYVPWIKRACITAQPVLHNHHFTLKSKGSCQFNEGALAQSCLSSHELPIPAGSKQLEVAYDTSLLPGVYAKKDPELKLSVYENGLLQGTYFAAASSHWQHISFQHAVHSTAERLSFVLSLQQSGVKGGVLVIDDLQVRFS
ncbi:hypothetical protein [Chitinophaga skermanii]|nr:hypothetical protein [Chitinophaga skermanii]